MATYQFKIEFLPKVWAENNKYDPKLLYDVKQDEGFEQYDLSIAWKNHIFSIELSDVISNILPENKSWDSNLLIWGNEEQSDIKVWLEDKSKMESITIRLDLRDNFDKLANNIVALAEKIDCVLFLPETKQIINPSLIALHDAINNSSAAKFVKEPIKYLEKKMSNQDKDS